jgi:hypothetical protein
MSYKRACGARKGYFIACFAGIARETCNKIPFTSAAGAFVAHSQSLLYCF